MDAVLATGGRCSVTEVRVVTIASVTSGATIVASVDTRSGVGAD